jgi:hypothetical protein
MNKLKYLILFLILILEIDMKAQKSCSFVTLNQVEIEDASDTAISGYFRINDYLLTSEGAVKFDIKAQFNPNSDFKYVKLYSDSLCNNYLMSLDQYVSTTEPYKIDGNFVYNFNVCDTTIRVFLKFRMYDFNEFIYGMDVELRSFVGINSAVENVKIRIYPNPVIDKLFIDSKKNENKLLFNSLGELVLETTSNTIDFSELSEGIYILRINDISYKLIK